MKNNFYQLMKYLVILGLCALSPLIANDNPDAFTLTPNLSHRGQYVEEQHAGLRENIVKLQNQFQLCTMAYQNIKEGYNNHLWPENLKAAIKAARPQPVMASIHDLDAFMAEYISKLNAVDKHTDTQALERLQIILDYQTMLLKDCAKSGFSDLRNGPLKPEDIETYPKAPNTRKIKDLAMLSHEHMVLSSLVLSQAVWEERIRIMDHVNRYLQEQVKTDKPIIPDWLIKPVSKLPVSKL